MSTSSIAIDLEESHLSRKVISLAWPAIGEQLFVTFVGLASTIMVGRLGAAALAATGLGTQATFVPQVVFNGVAVGATAIIARRIGEGANRGALVALHQSVLMAAIIGLLFTPVVWFLAEPIMVVLQAKPDVMELGAVFIRSSILGLTPSMIMLAANAAMRGAGHTRTPMVVMIAANVSNIVIGYVLIYGVAGLPPMGVLGAGIATSLAWVVGCIVALAFIVNGVGPLRLDIRQVFRFELESAKGILNIGFPAALEQLQIQIAFTTFCGIVSGLGTVYFAAQTVALRVENIAWMFGFGFSVASATLVGQALGAGRPDLAQRAATLAMWYAGASMTATAVLMVIFRTELMGIFVSDKEVIEIGAVAMLIYAISMPFQGVGNCLSGGLRGAGDTRSVLYIMTFCGWVLRLPLAYALAYWTPLGAAGAWSAAIFDINSRTLFFWWRFATGRWKTIKV